MYINVYIRVEICPFPFDMGGLNIIGLLARKAIHKMYYLKVQSYVRYYPSSEGN